MSELRRCAICDATSREARVEASWARFATRDADPLDVQPVDRCQDRAACRRRVVASGREWPVVDSPDRRPEVPTR